MSSTLRLIRNASPIPFDTPGLLSSLFSGKANRNATSQLEAMGSVGTLFAIVDLVATNTAMHEWALWRKARSGKPEDRVRVPQHAALDLWNRPNPFMGRQQFIHGFQQHRELTGERWWVLGYNPVMKTLPCEMWYVRPDRIEPVPHPTDFISGYIYHGPRGEKIPLEPKEVIPGLSPNPMDPYRGMGPVQSILAELDASRFSAEWNRNFFLNSAQPGGVIEVDKTLSDTDFRKLRDRWNEQHKGVQAAHRIAILEHGKYSTTAFTMRDMQFTELRYATRDTIMEAFRIHKGNLGISDDVNRANAHAGEYVYAKRHDLPRLTDIRSSLNDLFLPLFFPPGAPVDLEFDFENPVPDDKEFDVQDRTARIDSALKVIAAGYESAEVFEYFELPDFTEVEKEPIPAALVPGAVPAEGEEDGENLENRRGRIRHRRAPRFQSAIPETDLQPVRDAHEREFAALMEEWSEDILPDWRTELETQIVKAVNKNDLNKLANLTVDTSKLESALIASGERMADAAIDQVTKEAQKQGVTLFVPMRIRNGLLSDFAEKVAKAVAAVRAKAITLLAGREALRLNQPDTPGETVAEQVDAFVLDASQVSTEAEFRAVLTGIQNQARIEAMVAGPVAKLYADETLDENTCTPCEKVDGKFLGRTDDKDAMARMRKIFGFMGGYSACEGRDRCRGTIVSDWTWNKE